jgi:hypothetical protein
LVMNSFFLLWQRVRRWRLKNLATTGLMEPGLLGRTCITLSNSSALGMDTISPAPGYLAVWAGMPGHRSGSFQIFC